MLQIQIIAFLFAALPFFPVEFREFSQTWNFPAHSGIRFHERKQASQVVPALVRFRLIANALQQAMQQAMNGMGAVLQRDRFSAAEPLHQKSHRGHMILAIQQRCDNLSETAGSVKVFDMLPPERNIASRFSGGAPFSKDTRHLSRCFDGFHAFDMSQIIHGCGCIAIPLIGKFAEILQHGTMQILFPGRRRFTHR